MRASFFALAFATSALAQTANFDVLTSPTEQETFTVGDATKGSLPIVWTPGTSTGTVTLTLIGGIATNALSPITVIAAGVQSQTGSYTWTIPSTVGNFATYGVNLTSDADPSNTFQYSYAFHIVNSNTVSSSSSSVSASSTSASTSASSSIKATTSIPVTTTANVTAATVTTSCTGTTLSTAVAQTTAAGVFPSNHTAATGASSTASSTSNSSSTSKPTQPTTAGAAHLKVTGALAAVAGLLFAIAL